ncbi:hypothetical protein AFGD_000810 [Aspergillus flavus]|nr:hypothetical protein AFGD_000810 [Aspergillus flavus]
METSEPNSHVSITREGVASVQELDNLRLRPMGKKPVLQMQLRQRTYIALYPRNLGILSIFGFSCTLLGTWEGLLGTFIRPLGESGGTVYAFISAWVGTKAFFAVLSKLTSLNACRSSQLD